MKPNDLEHRVRSLAWPAPSERLRARILADVSVSPRSVTWSDRVWFSRTWRLSMAALVVAVLAIRAWPDPRDIAALAPSPKALADAEAIEETGREIGLSPAVAASLARRALTQPRPRATAFDPRTLTFLNEEETRRD